MRLAFCLFSYVFFLSVASAQSNEGFLLRNTSMSPSSDALSTFSPSVNLSTGTASIGLPLASIQGHSMRIPVSMGYQSTGIRVNDVASYLGLGWGLQSGGVITRIVRGLPDDEFEYNNSSKKYIKKGYSGVGSWHISDKGSADDITQLLNADPQTFAGSQVYDRIKHMEKKKWDSEPDIYIFNFMGRTGRFILDENKQPILIPKQDLQIYHILPASVGFISNYDHSAWVITTSDGTNYVFGSTAFTLNNTSVGLYTEKSNYKIETPGLGIQLSSPNAGAPLIPAQTTTYSYTSSWYLNEIISPNGNTEAEFAYQRGNSVSYAEVYHFRYDFLNILLGVGVDASLFFPSTHALKTTVTISGPLYVSRISGPASGEEIRFTYDSDREDLVGGKRLTRIDTRNSVGATIKSLRLSYSYFGNQADTKRLRLDKVQENNLPPFQFTYNTAIELPRRNSQQIDHWGYLNTLTPVNNAIPACDFKGEGINIYTANSWTPANPFVRAGTNREANPATMQAGILTSITYPTGGKVTYTYGTNQYWSSVTNTNLNWGGLRIEKVTAHDGSNPAKDMVTEYVYTQENNVSRSSGVVDNSFLSNQGTISPRFYQRPMLLTDRSALAPLADITGIGRTFKADSYLVRSAQPSMLLPDLVYSCVAVKQSGKGKTVNLFTTYATTEYDCKDVLPEIYSLLDKIRYDLASYPDVTYLLNYSNRQLRGWRRGLLTDSKVYNETGKLKLWNHLDYEFKSDTRKYTGLTFHSLEAINKDVQYGLATVLYSFFCKYEEIPEWVSVSRSTEKMYDQNDDAKFMETLTEYTYNPHNLQVASVTRTDNNGEKIITRYKYPVDYPIKGFVPTNTSFPTHPYFTDYLSPINTMLKRGITGQLIETQVWRKRGAEEEKLLSASITEFAYVSRPQGSGNSKPYAYYRPILPLLGDGLAGGVGNAGGLSIIKYRMIVPTGTYQYHTVAPVSVAPANPENYFFASIRDDGTFLFNFALFKEEVTFTRFDNLNGNLLEANRRNDISSAILYDEKGVRVIASATNAAYNQIAYTSFEAYGDKGNWTYGTPTAGDAKTGYQHITGGQIQSPASLPGGRYKVTFWYKGSGSVTINGTAVALNQPDWTYYETTLLSSGQVTVSPGTLKLDELRLYPAGAKMTTQTYNLMAGLRDRTDVNNITTYYTYDEFERIKTIQDKNNNILRHYMYWTAGQDVPDWSRTGTVRCRVLTTGPTGQKETEERDTNPYSPTYNQVRWITTFDFAACPLCDGNNKKWINGDCETSMQLNRISCFPFPNPANGLYTCTYQYGPFSDGSYGPAFNVEGMEIPQN